MQAMAVLGRRVEGAKHSYNFSNQIITNTRMLKHYLFSGALKAGCKVGDDDQYGAAWLYIRFEDMAG
jgi:hypothetical protein